MFFPLKLHFSITAGGIIARGEVLGSLEYDVFVSEILCVTPTVNTNVSLLKFKDITLTTIKTKPFVLKWGIK